MKFFEIQPKILMERINVYQINSIELRIKKNVCLFTQSELI